MAGGPGQPNWLAPLIALGGGGLAAAGRAGSPASSLGTSILGAYAERAMTAGDRERRQALEDFLIQRMKQRDVQESNQALANYYLQSGLWEPVAPGESAQTEIEYGGRKLGFRQRERPDVGFAVRAYEEALGPEFGKAARAGGFKGTPEEQMRQLAAFASAWPAREQRQQREQALGAIEGMSRYTAPDTGQEWAVRGPTPPTLSPEAAQVLRWGVSGTVPWQSAQEALRLLRPPKPIGEQIQEFQRALGQPPAAPSAGPPGVGIPMPPAATAAPGRVGYTVQQTAEGEPRVGVTYQPPTQAETQEQQIRQAHMAMAREMLADPQLKAMKLGTNERLTVEKLLRAASQTGSPETLASAWNILLKVGEESKPSLDRMRAAYFEKYPEAFERFMQGQIEGKETPSDLGRRLNQLMELLTLTGDYAYQNGVPDLKSNPRRAKVESQVAMVWRRLGDKFPEDYGAEALKNRAIYEHWDKARFFREVEAFKKRHKIQDLGGAE